MWKHVTCTSCTYMRVMYMRWIHMMFSLLLLSSYTCVAILQLQGSTPRQRPWGPWRHSQHSTYQNRPVQINYVIKYQLQNITVPVVMEGGLALVFNSAAPWWQDFHGVLLLSFDLRLSHVIWHEVTTLRIPPRRCWHPLRWGPQSAWAHLADLNAFMSLARDA